MDRIVKINKPIILKYEDREINLPEDLKEKIKNFWNKAIEENPNLYNGQDYTIESIIETNEQIEMLVVKTNYAHYLYEERIGILEREYKCRSPWSGIVIITDDNYLLIGEMDKTTSVPYCLQIPGGGIDKNDIESGIINIDKNLKRELKEKLNLNLMDIEYKIEYLEQPTEKRHVYGFIALGKINKTKEELQQHFETYKKYLIDNNLEVEFNKLVFLNLHTALQELDYIQNPKRPYLRDLIKEIGGR